MSKKQKEIKDSGRVFEKAVAMKKLADAKSSPSELLLAEIESILAERDQEKSAKLWENVETEKLISFVDLKALEISTISAKIKLVSFILQTRVIAIPPKE